MTISSTIRKAGPYSGNAITVSFPFTFKVFATSDVYVVQTDLSSVETVKALTTDYTVVLNADQNASAGGTITMLVAPPAGYLLTISSQVPNLQPTDITNNSGFYPKVVVDALDRLTILIQQLALGVASSLQVPFSSTQTPSAYLTSLIGTSVASSASAGISATSANASAVSAANSAALAGQSFVDASVTSNTVSTGSKTFTISANKNWQTGQFVIINDTTAPTTNYMLAQVTSYNSSTGALVINVVQATGSGTKTSWSFAISGSVGTNGTNGTTFTWKGTWSSATTYAVNDVATDGLASYICISANTNQVLSNATYWTLMVARGATGATGNTGAQGITWRGAWSGATAYVANDAVNSGGSSYICILANTNQLTTNTTYWSVLAQQGTTGAGTGDTSSNTASSVVNEIALFADTTGKLIKRSTGSGIMKLISGVLSSAVSGTDYAPATSGTSILKGDGLGGHSNAVAGTDYQSPVGTISGIAKGNGANALTAAVSGTDYQLPVGTISGLAKGNGANALTAAVANTDYLPVANPTATGALTVPLVQSSQGTDIASSATTNLETATGNYVNITGTSSITAITLNQGHFRFVKFAGALTLTNSASLILPSGANITTVAGDTAIFVGEATGVVRCLDYVRASGSSVVAASGNPSGTIITFAGTAPPSGYLTCPTSLTNISRATYATLFAAIGTTWGVGDGSTTFGFPWFAANYAMVQASANVGTTSVGAVISHSHTTQQFVTGTISNCGSQGGTNTQLSYSSGTDAFGGTANLAAGTRVLMCIKT